MFGEVMLAVTGRAYVSEPSVIHGHARYLVGGATYPGLVTQAGSRVDGVLYSEISRSSLTRLDAFEGDYYSRQTVQVTRADGTSTEAQTYVFRSEYLEILTEQAWDPDRFRDNHLVAFIRTYQGFSTIPPDPK